MIIDHVQAVQELLSSSGRLNPWEQRFCAEMIRVKSPTPKQLNVPGGLVLKVHAPTKRPRRRRLRSRRAGSVPGTSNRFPAVPLAAYPDHLVRNPRTGRAGAIGQARSGEALT